MKHNVKSEMRQSMDALHFSEEAKNAMVNQLLAQSSQGQKSKFSGRKMMTVMLAAALAVMMLTGAAVYTRWSQSAENRYKPTQQIKEQAEKSGLSVMLEETKGSENPNEVLSVTDQGITITVVQTIVDKYGAELTFRIEGFDLPEDRAPEAWPVVTIDGERFGFFSSQGGAFYDGTTRNEEGEWVYVSSGEPVKSRNDKYQSVIFDYVLDDGSLEYTHYISFHETDGRYFGKEIEMKFSYVGTADEKGSPGERLVEGDWTLRWILTGTSDSITITPNAKIGDSDVILLDAEIGQKTIRARYKVDDYWEGWNELVTLPQAVCGVRMKDGSQYFCYATTSGFEDQENMIYFTESNMFDVILNPSEVESLVFHKGWEKDANGEPTIETFYYIPVSAS